MGWSRVVAAGLIILIGSVSFACGGDDEPGASSGASTQGSGPGTSTLAIAELTSPVSAGESATLTAKSSSGADCSISYTTPGGNQARAAGLEPQVADGAGALTWTWTIHVNTLPGTGAVRVICGGESAIAEIVISPAN